MKEDYYKTIVQMVKDEIKKMDSQASLKTKDISQLNPFG